jgi:hypothetical protein
MTDKQMSYAFYWIGKQQLERTPDFWSVILPAVKKQLTTLDRNCTKSLKAFIEGAAAMQLQDNEFWATIEQKLVDEKLHKYFNLEDLTEILVSLSVVGRGSDELLEIVEKTLIKHRKGLTAAVISNAEQGFKQFNKGSEILYRVLSDPSTKLPQLGE